MSLRMAVIIKSASVAGLVMISLSLTIAQQVSTASHGSTEPAVLANQDTEPPVMVRSPASILAAFVKAETLVREALNQHTFKREVVLQTIGPNGQVTGEYIRNSQFLFDDKGNRIERVTYHPPSTIREMRITREDIQDLAGSQLLGIDIGESTKYSLAYTGQETFGGVLAYVLTVEPATKPDPQRMSERFFCGRVWIDAATFQIIKVRGLVEPRGKQRFPMFQTWRELVSSTLYLPTRTEADDVLHFPNRSVNYRVRVRYYDYKLFTSKLKITEIDEPGN